MIFVIFLLHICLLSITGDAAIEKSKDKSTIEETPLQFKSDSILGQPGFYCGRHLHAMGYENTSPNILYMVYSDSPDQGSFIQDCSATGCKGIPRNAFCLCEIDKKYCGFDLVLRGFDIPFSAAHAHTLYRCRKGNTVSLVEKCSHRCWSDEIDGAECVFGLNGEVEKGRHYCGLEIAALMKVEKWDPHTLYECMDERTGWFRVATVCESGCIPSAIDGAEAYCDIGRVAYLPPSDQKKNEL